MDRFEDYELMKMAQQYGSGEAKMLVKSVFIFLYAYCISRVKTPIFHPQKLQRCGRMLKSPGESRHK